jgi:uncharacterized protein (DUF305 family)
VPVLRLFRPALLVLWWTAIGSAQVVQPGAPGQPARVISPDDAVAHALRAPSRADVQFMQQMIGHHAQALEMTALAKTRTSNADLLALAARIETSQRDEIRMMLEWLRSHDLPAPDEHAHHAPGAVLMP